MKTLATMAIAALLVGCAAPNQHWAKTGATQADLSKDCYECERDAKMIPYQQNPYAGSLVGLSLDMQDRENRMKFYERCLESKGWQKTN